MTRTSVDRSSGWCVDLVVMLDVVAMAGVVVLVTVAMLVVVPIATVVIILTMVAAIVWAIALFHEYIADPARLRQKRKMDCIGAPLFPPTRTP